MGDVNIVLATPRFQMNQHAGEGLEFAVADEALGVGIVMDDGMLYCVNLQPLGSERVDRRLTILRLFEFSKTRAHVRQVRCAMLYFKWAWKSS
jgi:hypothetical protein